MTRTFLAVYPDAPTLARVTALLERLRSRVDGVRWTPEHQLHFTLRFFGDLDRAQLDAAARTLAERCPALSPVSLPLNGLGVFPDWRRPRVLWVGSGAGGEELEEIARRLELAFREAGLGRADKPFKAHLTLGRFREGSRAPSTALEYLRREGFATPPFPVAEVRLMASELSPRGATHRLVAAVPLGPPTS